jgi:ribose transport system ATP-binding protein
MDESLLRMQDIDLSFSGVPILRQARLEVVPGEIHALLGSNGAGKSSLMKILTGIYRRDAGRIFFRRNGELSPLEVSTPRQSQEVGISIVHQEFNLLDNLSVAENLYMVREPLGWFCNIDWRRLRQQSRELLQNIDLDIDPMEMVGNLTVGQKQMVEIAKSLSFKSRLLVMDEPTATLSAKETDILFGLLLKLRSDGMGIIYISHRLEEVFRIGDRATIMRDGCYINCLRTVDTTQNEIIRLMTGRVITGAGASQRAIAGEPVLEVRNYSNDHLKKVDFALGKGEIIGLFGLVGAGRTELARAVFGIDRIETGGELFLHGKRARIHSPGEGVKNGMGLVPEDRKKYGAVMGMSVRHNLILAKLKEMSAILFRSKTEKRVIDEYIRKLDIKLADVAQPLSELSGGNQQKVIMAKWLALRPDILILDEPTRGIDVGAKDEIYKIMREYAAMGVSILMISSELPEIMGISDRVMVMREGRVTLKKPIRDTDSQEILAAAIGG